MYRLDIAFQKHPNNLLSELSHKYNSDKGAPENSIQKLDWNYHIYTDIYYLLFNLNRQKINTVFELGIGTNNLRYRSNMGTKGTPGASLRMWRDFFPNAVIIGADVDRDILFQENRIETFYVDQTDESSISELWSKIDHDFEIMIDDGLHSFEANINFLSNSFHKLKIGGVYLIEDIKNEEVGFFEKYLKTNNFNFYLFKFDKSTNSLITNSFCIILK
jgi:hypothetical protein